MTALAEQEGRDSVPEISHDKLPGQGLSLLTCPCLLRSRSAGAAGAGDGVKPSLENWERTGGAEAAAGPPSTGKFGDVEQKVLRGKGTGPRILLLWGR